VFGRATEKQAELIPRVLNPLTRKTDRFNTPAFYEVFLRRKFLRPFGQAHEKNARSSQMHLQEPAPGIVEKLPKLENSENGIFLLTLCIDRLSCSVLILKSG
jgi:hypothetical protein